MNQFILGGGDPVLAGTQIDEQIQLLEGQFDGNKVWKYFNEM